MCIRDRSEGRKEIDFGDVPFALTNAKLYDCQFGVKYFKQRPVQGKRLWLQGSRRHFVSLPCEEAHSGHPTGEAAGYSQKLIK